MRRWGLWGKSLEQFRAIFRHKPRDYIFEPVVHRLDPTPILPQEMMSSIAPAYEEALAKEKEEEPPRGTKG